MEGNRNYFSCQAALPWPPSRPAPSVTPPPAQPPPPSPPAAERGGGPSSMTVGTVPQYRFSSLLVSPAADILPEPVEASNVESSIENDDSLTERLVWFSNHQWWSFPSHRQGRFLLYWLTTTSTSTATSFTKTVSVVSVYCTPSGASLCWALMTSDY